MYRYNYPAIYELWRAIRRIALLLSGLILFFIAVELVRAYQLFAGFHPVAGHVFAVLVLGLAAWLAVRAITRRHDRQTLISPPRPDGRSLRHEDLVAYCNYLVHRLKRLSLNRRLEETAQKKVRQRAYDIEGLLGSHPLIEDLTRAITRAEIDTLEPVLAELDRQAEELGKAKIRAVVEDSVEPPFPVITPLVVLYHQITLITTITDLYLGHTSLREYGRVLADVAATVRGGEFFRIGQRLFEGAYVNSPPLGPAMDDLGQAITCTWLTWSVTKATSFRCRSITPWAPDEAVEWLDRHTADSLHVVREVLINDVLPLLKLRIRHSAGPGVADAVGFSEQVTQSVARAVDMVVKGLTTQNPAKAAQLSRRTQPGLVPTPVPPVRAKVASSRTWRRRGFFGILRSYGERLRYARRHKSLDHSIS